MRPRIARASAIVAFALTLLATLGASARTARALDYSQLSPIQRRIISGSALLNLTPPEAQAGAATRRGTYFPTSDDGCPQSLGHNVRVDQSCENVTHLAFPPLVGAGQAHNETSIAADPYHPSHLVAAYNDYEHGNSRCTAAYSLDDGRSWSNAELPADVTTGEAFGGLAQFWQAAQDPSVAWDTRGNVYAACRLFNSGPAVTTNPDTSSGVYVFRSTGNDGASWSFPGYPVVENRNLTGSGAPFEDKPYLTVDSHRGSPFQDRVYVTWTEFSADGTAYVWSAHSSDFGKTFSGRALVSTDRPTLCANTYALPTPSGNCNENQASQPFTGPDGTLYVVYANFNNATVAPDNRNQVLLAKSTDGGVTFSPPVKVADFYDLPDCATYQAGNNPGSPCVPEKGSAATSYFRAQNYPTGAVDPSAPGRIVVAFGSYVNRDSKESNGCVPTGFAGDGVNLYVGVKTPGACKNTILLSVSDDRGATFTGTRIDPRDLPTATAGGRQVATDQWWQWIAFGPRGTLAVSYYDRQYGDDETTGFSDLSVAGSGDLRSFDVRRVTSASMPPPTEFGGDFFGDYAGLAVTDQAHPAWMDTRNPELFDCTRADGSPGVCTAPAANASVSNNQDVVTDAIPIPRPERPSRG